MYCVTVEHYIILTLELGCLIKSRKVPDFAGLGDCVAARPCRSTAPVMR